LCKYADDTYVIIPSDKVEKKAIKLENVEKWARANNLTLKCAKCVEIIFHDTRRKRQLVMPPPLSDIPRIQSIKVLGVTITSSLSVAQHVNEVISTSAQTVHAHRLLRVHGMTNESLNIIYRSVVIAKLTYAASAWWATPQLLTANAWKQSSGVPSTHLCSNDVPTLAELVERADDDLFEKILSNPYHVLCNILPDETVPFYRLRTRRHNRELVDKTSHVVS